MNRRRIPTIIGVFFLVFGVAAGVLLVQQRQFFRLGASGETAPRDVRVSNVTDTSFTVSWTTEKQTVGFVEFGETTELGSLARQEDSSLKYVHSVTLRQLSPSTNYFFVINSGGSIFKNSGIPWPAQTGITLPSPEESLLISGTVLTNSGSPAGNVLIYVTSGVASQLSTITSSNGSWIIPLSSARTTSLNTYAKIDPESTLLDITVQGGPLGVATAKAFPTNANPTPAITLGQSYDFRDETVNKNPGTSDAVVDLPDSSDETSSSSGFVIDETSDTVVKSGGQVSLDSIDSNGEVLFTDSPEFFGSGPANRDIVVTVESEPQSETVKVSSSGTWSWSAPNILEAGPHTIKIVWKDAQGILRQITREFVVQAQDGSPAFESTPSGTIKPSSSPSPTPSPTPKPTATPKPSPSPTVSPSPSPSPTPTQRVSIPATGSGVPVAGSLTPTLILVTMGLGLIGIGFFISKKASN